MTPDRSDPAHRARDEAWQAFVRTAPTALTLVPVCLLLGVLAAQSHWSAWEVLLFSALGFTGSGQFALVPLAAQGQSLPIMIALAISINSRYVPMALATAHRLPAAPLQRGIAAHLLGDEAFAIERAGDSHKSMFVVRGTIYAVWVLSTVAGALLANLIPPGLIGPEVNLAFPASVVLLVLTFGQLKVRVPQIPATWLRRMREVGMCAAVALVFLALLGPVGFWLPSIAFSTWRLGVVGR